MKKVKKKDKYRKAKGLFLMAAKEWGMGLAMNKVGKALVSEMLERAAGWSIWESEEPNEKMQDLPSKKSGAYRAFSNWGDISIQDYDKPDRNQPILPSGEI